LRERIVVRERAWHISFWIPHDCHAR
jgi:hypothetical protein